MGKFCVVRQERACAEEHAAIPVVGDFRNDAIVKWRRVEKKVHPRHNRQKRPACKTERMENGKGIKHFVLNRKVYDRPDLGDIGEYGLMG